LTYTPGGNFNGIDSFKFKVTDTGDGSSPALDSTDATVSINVRSVNDAPSGTDKTVTTNEDLAYTFATGDFGFSDPNDSPPNSLLAVKISTLPGAGSLTNNGTAVVAGQYVSAADITAGKLVFTPVSNANGTPYAAF